MADWWALLIPSFLGVKTEEPPSLVTQIYNILFPLTPYIATSTFVALFFLINNIQWLHRTINRKINGIFHTPSTPSPTETPTRACNLTKAHTTFSDTANNSYYQNKFNKSITVSQISTTKPKHRKNQSTCKESIKPECHLSNLSLNGLNPVPTELTKSTVPDSIKDCLDSYHSKNNLKNKTASQVKNCDSQTILLVNHNPSHLSTSFKLHNNKNQAKQNSEQLITCGTKENSFERKLFPKGMLPTQSGIKTNLNNLEYSVDMKYLPGWQKKQLNYSNPKSEQENGDATVFISRPLESTYSLNSINHLLNLSDIQTKPYPIQHNDNFVSNQLQTAPDHPGACTRKLEYNMHISETTKSLPVIEMTKRSSSITNRKHRLPRSRRTLLYGCSSNARRHHKSRSTPKRPRRAVAAFTLDAGSVTSTASVQSSTSNTIQPRITYSPMASPAKALLDIPTKALYFDCTSENEGTQNTASTCTNAVYETNGGDRSLNIAETSDSGCSYFEWEFGSVSNEQNISPTRPRLGVERRENIFHIREDPNKSKRRDRSKSTQSKLNECDDPVRLTSRKCFSLTSRKTKKNKQKSESRSLLGDSKHFNSSMSLSYGIMEKDNMYHGYCKSNSPSNHKGLVKHRSPHQSKNKTVRSQNSRVGKISHKISPHMSQSGMLIPQQASPAVSKSRRANTKTKENTDLAGDLSDGICQSELLVSDTNVSLAMFEVSDLCPVQKAQSPTVVEPHSLPTVSLDSRQIVCLYKLALKKVGVGFRLSPVDVNSGVDTQEPNMPEKYGENSRRKTKDVKEDKRRQLSKRGSGTNSPMQERNVRNRTRHEHNSSTANAGSTRTELNNDHCHPKERRIPKDIYYPGARDLGTFFNESIFAISMPSPSPQPKPMNTQRQKVSGKPTVVQSDKVHCNMRRISENATPETPQDRVNNIISTPRQDLPQSSTLNKRKSQTRPRSRINKTTRQKTVNTDRLKQISKSEIQNTCFPHQQCSSKALDKYMLKNTAKTGLLQRTRHTEYPNDSTHKCKSIKGSQHLENSDSSRLQRQTHDMQNDIDIPILYKLENVLKELTESLHSRRPSPIIDIDTAYETKTNETQTNETRKGSAGRAKTNQNVFKRKNNRPDNDLQTDTNKTRKEKSHYFTNNRIPVSYGKSPPVHTIKPILEEKPVVRPTPPLVNDIHKSFATAPTQECSGWLRPLSGSSSTQVTHLNLDNSPTNVPSFQRNAGPPKLRTAARAVAKTKKVNACRPRTRKSTRTIKTLTERQAVAPSQQHRNIMRGRIEIQAESAENMDTRHTNFTKNHNIPNSRRSPRSKQASMPFESNKVVYTSFNNNKSPPCDRKTLQTIKQNQKQSNLAHTTGQPFRNTSSKKPPTMNRETGLQDSPTKGRASTLISPPKRALNKPRNFRSGNFYGRSPASSSIPFSVNTSWDVSAGQVFD